MSEFIANIVGSFDTGKIQADSVKIQEKIQNNIENVTKNLKIKKENKSIERKIGFS
ncbi:hypothetical protein ACQGX2_001853 [Campylobacter jejuni]|uniref:hypothetical protein n=1 Tax=Campylobacter jejuni TaxID=197 RepID=UPI0020448CC0|nr:hypothetical protein [Campylobacter jejuni]MDT9648790.1 hypothetical protein [Campylobacter jejuni]MDT9672674.1 hypothetical protein [Campylobacter jejuni]BEK31540.1 hypothetical protein B11411_09100 [Campylobacter jejuni]